MVDDREDMELAHVQNRWVRHVHGFMDIMETICTMHYTDVSHRKDHGTYGVFCVPEKRGQKVGLRHDE